MHPPATTPRFDLAVAPSTVRPPKAQGPGGNGKHGKDARRAPRARQALAVARALQWPVASRDGVDGRRTDGDEEPQR